MKLTRPEVSSEFWIKKAQENIDKWGLQDVSTLILAMMEELGELAQAHLQAVHEHKDPERISEELDDLMVLGYQLREAYING